MRAFEFMEISLFVVSVYLLITLYMFIIARCLRLRCSSLAYIRAYRANTSIRAVDPVDLVGLRIAKSLQVGRASCQDVYPSWASRSPGKTRWGRLTP